MRRESRRQEHASGGLRPPQTRAATLLRDARHDGPSGRPDDGAQDARRLARADAQAEVDHHRGAAALEPDGAFELPAFRGFLETEVRGQFDYVLVDAPRVTVATDYYAVVGALGGGVLLVMDARGTRKNSLRRGIQDLEGVGASMLGTILYNVAVCRGEYATYGYGPRGQLSGIPRSSRLHPGTGKRQTEGPIRKARYRRLRRRDAPELDQNRLLGQLLVEEALALGQHVGFGREGRGVRHRAGHQRPSCSHALPLHSSARTFKRPGCGPT